ncbi:hypothetical protein T05_8751 [Trichinella murrelli]|uniref:Uncharacterized protein n=1 Tax=Trichinella murrelli TaxID=144512 RepID=A0A0V0UI47_9BILA|nr:hypothetical protein T05_8751 [Trichinella murrelli]
MKIRNNSYFWKYAINIFANEFIVLRFCIDKRLRFLEFQPKMPSRRDILGNWQVNFEYGINQRLDYQLLKQPVGMKIQMIEMVYLKEKINKRESQDLTSGCQKTEEIEGKEEQKPTFSFTIKFTSLIAFAITISFEFCYSKTLALM